MEGSNELWRTAVQFDADKNAFGAVAAYTLLLLLEQKDVDTVQTVHFRDRLTRLVASLDERSLFSRPAARLYLLAEEDEEEELASSGMLQVFDEAGSMRLLVCVGERGFLVEPCAVLPNNPLVVGGRYEFRPAGFAVCLPEPDPLFVAALVPPALPRVLHESTRVVEAFSASVSDAIRAGAASVAARIQSTSVAAAAAVAVAEPAAEDGGEEEGGKEQQPQNAVLAGTAAGAQLARQRTEELSARLKVGRWVVHVASSFSPGQVSGAHAGQVLREQAGPVRNASAAGGLQLAASTALGAMAVLGALWESGGQLLRASGQGAVEVAGARYGPAVRGAAQQSLDATVDAVVAVDTVLAAPKTLVRGALE